MNGESRDRVTCVLAPWHSPEPHCHSPSSSHLFISLFVDGSTLCWQNKETKKHQIVFSPTPASAHVSLAWSKENIFFWKKTGLLLPLLLIPLLSPSLAPLWGVHIKAIQILPRFNNQFRANGRYFTERVSFGGSAATSNFCRRAESINLNLFRLTF